VKLLLIAVVVAVLSVDVILRLLSLPAELRRQRALELLAGEVLRRIDAGDPRLAEVLRRIDAGHIIVDVTGTVERQRLEGGPVHRFDGAGLVSYGERPVPELPDEAEGD
jgi:hypothetical protein